MGACQSSEAGVGPEEAATVNGIRALFIGPHHAGKSTLIKLINNIISSPDFPINDDDSHFDESLPSPKSVSSAFGHFNTEVMAQARYVKAAVSDFAKAHAIALLEAISLGEFSHLENQQIALIRAVANSRDLHVLVNQIAKCKCFWRSWRSNLMCSFSCRIVEAY
jgi:ABC-type polar amino acid transport system ATPase subunit